MNKIAAILMFVIVSFTPLFGGESWHEKEFEVKASPKVISDWLKKNPKEIASYMGGELISKNGDKVRIRQDTPKGIMEFTLEETLKENGDTYDYMSKLVEVHEGLIEDQMTVVKLTPKGSGSIVTIRLSATVRDVKPAQIRSGLAKSIRGFQEMVERKVR